MSDCVDRDEYDQMHNRAMAAEEDLEALLIGLNALQKQMETAKYGPAIFRSEVADKLREVRVNALA